MIRFAAAVLMLLGGLTACGTVSSPEKPLGIVVDSVSREQTFDPRFVALARAKAPALQIGLVDNGSNGTLLLEKRSGDFTYWLSAEGAQLILEDGMLSATRGFGEGLLASELSQPLAAVRGLKTGASDRFHTYLDGNDRAVTRTFRCRFDNEGTRAVDYFGTQRTTYLLRESCRGINLEFENLYWVDPASRDILFARQWSGPLIGAISTRAVPR